MKRIIAWTILAASAGISGLSHANFIDQTIGGTIDPADLYNAGGVVADGFISEAELTATGSVSQFNIVGAVLLAYRINGTLVLTSDGTISIEADNTSAGTTVGAGDVFDVCSGSSGTFSCDVVERTEFTIAYTNFEEVIGTGSIDVSRTGNVSMFGGCTAGSNPEGDCSKVSWAHMASAALEDLRVEWSFCTTPGEGACPVLVPGVNSPGQDATGVPEPATLALFGLGLAGLAASRRLRSKRRT